MDEEIKKPIPRIEQEPQEMISVIPSQKVMIGNIFVESNVESLNYVAKLCMKLWKESREKGFRSYVD